MDAFTLLHADVRKPHHGRTLYGRLEELRPRLGAYNDLGYNVFWTVNPTDGAGRGASNIVEARWCWSDLDNGAPDTWPLIPSVLVESSPGRFQAYYKLEEPTRDFATWSRIERAVVKKTKGDANAQDLARILRVPGFKNHKRGGFVVRVTLTTGHSYSLDKLREVFGEVDAPQRYAMLEVPEELPSEAQRLKRFTGWMRKVGRPGGGERNGWLYKVACKGVIDFALDPGDVETLLYQWWDEHDASGDDPRIEQIVRNASKSATGVRGSAYVAPTFELIEEAS